MAESVNNSISEAEERRELEQFVPPLSRPRRETVYGGRFTLAYLLLIVVFGGIVALTTYLTTRDAAEEQWSAWQPRGEGLARATDIANHVAANYRSGSNPLVIVNAQPPAVQSQPVDVIAVAREPTQEVGGGFITIEPANRAIFYVFCGLGAGCSTGDAAVSQTLLRREALELSLYTFKYMDGVDSVVSLLPPNGQVTPAVYLRRRGYERLLDTPLGKTLTARPPFTASSITDAALVNRLTEAREFPAYFQRVSNGSVMLRLGGPPPQDEQEAGSP